MAKDPFTTGELEALSKHVENDMFRKCFCGKPAWRGGRDCEAHTKELEEFRRKRDGKA